MDYFDLTHLDFWLDKTMLDMDIRSADIRYIAGFINPKISMFTYKNLPNNLLPETLEMALLCRRQVCFFYSEGLGGVCLGTYNILSRDMNHQPAVVSIRTFNGNMISIDTKFEDIVPIKDNPLDLPPMLVIASYVNCVCKIEATLFQQVDIASLPFIFIGTPKAKKEFDNLVTQSHYRKPFALMDKEGVDSKSLPINFPITPTDMYDLKSKYKNECLQSFGIYSVEEKRERLLQQEVTNQNDYTDTNYQLCKLSRSVPIEKINSKWGCKVIFGETYEVNKKEDIADTAKEAGAVAKAEAEAQPKPKEGEPNGQNIPSK